MILIKHELKQGWKSLAVWTASIGFFIIICVFLYPEMKGEMEDMKEEIRNLIEPLAIDGEIHNKTVDKVAWVSWSVK